MLRRIFVAISFALVVSTSARAQLETDALPEPAEATVVTEKKPLWELGVFAGLAHLPDYPAADQGRLRYLAGPSLRYRGEIFRLDEDDNARARVSENRLYGFDISASGSFPASAENNRTRVALDDLDWIGELGPRVYWRMVEEPGLRIRLRLPVRAVFSSDFTNLRYRGLVIAPGLYLEKRGIAGTAFGVVAVGYTSFATRELQRYFYEVPADRATPVRPAYPAKAGYIGASTLVAATFEQPSYVVFTGLFANFHQGATNRKSPLFRRATNVGVAIGFNWLFWRSSQPAYD